MKNTWRDRLLWLSSPDASEAVLAGFGVTVMALAIVMTTSRGGLLCLVATVALLASWMVTRQSSTSRRVAAALFLAIAIVVAFAWGDVDAVLARFAGASPDMGGRLGIWRDALRIARDFPLTGTGLNTFGIAMLHYQTVPGDQLYIEAHNDYLHLLAEGGVLLAVPAIAALIFFVREVRRRFREAADDARTYWIRVGAVTGLCAIAIQECFDFTLQMPGAAVLFVVLAAIAIHRPARVAADTHPASA